MTNLVRTQQNPVRQTGVSQELAEHLHLMDMAALVAKLGIEELSEIYTYSEYKVVNSLVATDLYRNAFQQGGGTLTPAEEEAYKALRQQYLERMSQLSQIASTRVIRDVANVPRELPPRRVLAALFGG